MNNYIYRLLNHPNLGKLLLRVSFSLMMLGHGIHKITHGITGIKSMVLAKHLPEFIAYGVLIGEVVIPVLLILGIYTRISALILSFTMLMAIWLSNVNLFSLTTNGGWAAEIMGVYLFAGLAIALLGAGKYAIHQE